MVQEPKHRRAKPKRRATLTIISAVILVLTYTMHDLAKEKTKDLSDSLRSAEALYRSELGLSILATQDIAYKQLSHIREINAINSQPQRNRDYSDIIGSDLLTLQQVLGDLNSNFDSVSRFLAVFPPGGDDLRKERDLIRASVDKTNQQVKGVLNSSERHDWVRAVEVKMAIVVAAIQGIPVSVLGDAVLTRSQKFQETLDKLYRFSGWASYVLYCLGVGLALYANLSGTKSLGEAA
jgi:hypothetical protein